jgi:hypothetical protein
MTLTTLTLPLDSKCRKSAEEFMETHTCDGKFVVRYDSRLKRPLAVGLNGPEPTPETEIEGFLVVVR